MGDVKLNFLLMGKKLHGKSATGNTILNRRVFKEDSQTKDVDFNFVQFMQYILLVVDGPSLEETDLNKTTDKERAVKQMSKALAMCYGGIDAFLFVVKFGNRFTVEDKRALEALKVLFGDTFLEHVIVVVTFGDLFQETLHIESSDSNFQKWCTEQTEPFSQLYEACGRRFVLFNNIEKNDAKKQAQIQKVVQFAHGLQIYHGRYASQCFKDAELEREKLIENHNAPQLRLQIQEKICLLNAAIANLPRQPSMEDITKVTDELRELNREIDKQERKYGELQGLRKLAKKIERNLHNKETLHRLVEELDEERRAENVWSFMSAIGLVYGLAVAFYSYTVGPVVAAVWSIGSKIGDFFN